MKYIKSFNEGLNFFKRKNVEPEKSIEEICSVDRLEFIKKHRSAKYTIDDDVVNSISKLITNKPGWTFTHFKFGSTLQKKIYNSLSKKIVISECSDEWYCARVSGFESIGTKYGDESFFICDQKDHLTQLLSSLLDK